MAALDFTTFHNIIDGKLRASKKTRHGTDPSTLEALWEVPITSQDDLDDAVRAAKKAQLTWSQKPVDERREMIRKYMDLFKKYSDDFANLLCKECGKPKQDAYFENNGALGHLDHASKIQIPEEYEEHEDMILITRYKPLGVVGAISPWNFPLILSIGKVAESLMTGNCVIVKPSPFTPYSGLKMCELGQQIFPHGVWQAVSDDSSVGPMMTAHPGIDKISFTGSIATGKKIYEACAKTLKRVTLELGGNDAAIILPDVDIDSVAPQVAIGAFWNSGQVCVATKRIYIHESIYEQFLEAIVSFARQMKAGPPKEAGVMLGPIQNEMQYTRVKSFIQDSKQQGHTFAIGSAEIAKNNGFFIQPTIIDNPPNDSRIIREEQFGPIVPAQPWSSEEEVIRRANDSNTGLAASVWSKDVEHAQQIGWQLQAGSVYINSFEKPTPLAYFSGHKESGVGGEFGNIGWMQYCNVSVMHIYK